MQRGTFRPDRAASNEATPIGKATCPTWITDAEVKKEFRRLAKLLTEMGLIGAADVNVLARYSSALVRWRRIDQVLIANPKAEFATFKDEAGRVKSVQISAMFSASRSLSDELGRSEAVLGLTPSARSRIEVAAPAPTKTAAGPAKSRFFESTN